MNESRTETAAPTPTAKWWSDPVHPVGQFRNGRIPISHQIADSKKGSGRRLPGLTDDHLHPMLDNEHDSELLGSHCSLPVRLATKAGCERVSHVLQTTTDRDSRTVVSIDDVGAYDLISRNAMMERVLRMEQGDQILPFVRCFYGSPSTYLSEMKQENVQDIPQGEGARRPLRSCLHWVCTAHLVQCGSDCGTEIVFAFLDDVHVICAPGRVLDVYKFLEEEIFAHTHIRMHHEKTQVWNRGSVIPPGIETLTRVAQLTRPGAVVWRGDDSLPPSQQGIKILGIPVGQPENIRQFLEEKADKHRTLFHRIPPVEDPQEVWLLLLMCASTRANYWLRGVQPDWTSIFAATHDAHVWEFFRQIFGDQQKSLPRCLGRYHLGPNELWPSWTHTNFGQQPKP